ncbi:flagellar assembly protein FliH [Alteromonas lipolytica]|uniref:Flagellar assembly protein FliH n=1 Tax=Alteromonas lipolytica TaxID=1856405 RepID=A0A1E8FF99_9ALTE|nr:flagellar assembly protein FliH [Alteromonas lipolytica]OFI34612.1 flagellar assembly protein FliH [Alteromonas lipolytica]GGF52516.1 flagellar assembly protein FliH [Alteromonas lipolytica]
MKNARPFSVAELEEAQNWNLPYVDEAVSSQDDKTNALNRRSDWKYEPPEEVEEILPPTAQEIEAIRQAAFDEGYAEGKQTGFDEGKAEGIPQGHEEGRAAGHQEGFEQGLQEGQSQITQQAEVWESLVSQLHAPLEKVDEQVRREVVKLAVALARSVIRTEVQTNEAIILQALSEGLKVLPVEENHYSIHMHPEDIQLVQAHFGEDKVKERGWTLIDSPAMARGGCDIVTQRNAVDLSIERRSRNVLDKFLLEQGLSDDS